MIGNGGLPLFLCTLLAFLWHVVYYTGAEKYALRNWLFVRGAAARLFYPLCAVFVFRLCVWHFFFSFIVFGCCFLFCFPLLFFLAFLLSCFLFLVLHCLPFHFLLFVGFLVLSCLSLVAYCLSYLITTINNKYISIISFVCVRMCARTREERGGNKAQKRATQKAALCMLSKKST